MWIVAMKIVFVICEEVYENRIMEILARVGIDYYTCWEHVKGKGHETEAHLGTRSFPGLNAVLMIALPDEAPLKVLIGEIEEANKAIIRPDDRIRLFQVPLERIV
jgi:hypothetical protein